MTVRVVINNPSDDLLDALECVVKLDPCASMTMEFPDEEELSRDVAAEMEKELSELEKERIRGTAHYYNSMEEYKAAHSEIQDTDYNEVRQVS